MTQRAFTQREANVYLGFTPESRWLDDAPVAKVDMRRPGAGRPVWRWLKEDLDAFLELRRFAPGQPNPMEMQ